MLLVCCWLLLEWFAQRRRRSGGTTIDSTGRCNVRSRDHRVLQRDLVTPSVHKACALAEDGCPPSLQGVLLDDRKRQVKQGRRASLMCPSARPDVPSPIYKALWFVPKRTGSARSLAIPNTRRSCGALGPISSSFFPAFGLLLCPRVVGPGAALTPSCENRSPMRVYSHASRGVPAAKAPGTTGHFSPATFPHHSCLVS